MNHKIFPQIKYKISIEKNKDKLSDNQSNAARIFATTIQSQAWKHLKNREIF